mgnify:FL=1
MGIFTIVVLFIFAIFGIIIGIENNAVYVSIKFFNTYWNAIPIVLIMLYSFMAGLLFMLIIKIGDEIRFRSRIRKLEKHIKDLKVELDEIRILPIIGNKVEEEKEEEE